MQDSLADGAMTNLSGQKLAIAASKNFCAALLGIRFKLRKAVRLTGSFIGSFFCLALISLNAHAQYPSDPPAPPIRYNFGSTVGYYYKTYDVPTRFDLCTAWMNEMNPKAPNAPIWTNPRLPPTWGRNFCKCVVLVHIHIW